MTTQVYQICFFKIYQNFYRKSLLQPAQRLNRRPNWPTYNSAGIVNWRESYIYLRNVFAFRFKSFFNVIRTKTEKRSKILLIDKNKMYKEALLKKHGWESRLKLKCFRLCTQAGCLHLMKSRVKASESSSTLTSA